MVILIVLTVLLIVAFVAAFVSLPSALVYKKPSTRSLALTVAFLLLASGTMAWMSQSDIVFEGSRAAVGKYAQGAFDTEMSGTIYQSSDGEYFVLEDNSWNVLRPNSRVYLNRAKTEQYLTVYNEIHGTNICTLKK